MYFYVYRIICTHPDSSERYYYGSRQCQCLPQEDTTYWSSSRGVHEARQRFGEHWFRKKIVSIYSSRYEALAKEIRLHHYFDVKNHPQFFNLANQTSTRFLSRPLSLESRRKIAKALQGNTHTLGRAHSQTTRDKISQSMKGKQPSLGRHVSQARRGHAPFAGKRHTLETREKISQAMKASRAARKQAAAEETSSSETS